MFLLPLLIRLLLLLLLLLLVLVLLQHLNFLLALALGPSLLRRCHAHLLRSDVVFASLYSARCPPDVRCLLFVLIAVLVRVLKGQRRHARRESVAGSSSGGSAYHVTTTAGVWRMGSSGGHEAAKKLQNARGGVGQAALYGKPPLPALLAQLQAEIIRGEGGADDAATSPPPLWRARRALAPSPTAWEGIPHGSG